MKGKPKVSVIIPVYGVEKYIERCVRSLFEQTLNEIEYIFVDDCSPDRSIDILKSILQEYPNRIPQTKIVRMPFNGKQAAARNLGLDNATGDYIIHCDPDDYVDVHIYEDLYNSAYKHDADIAICDFRCIRNTRIYDVVAYDCYSSPQEAILTNIESTPWQLFNRVVKRELIENNNIRFFEGVNFMEDRSFLVRCNLVANKVVFVHKFLYFANRNNEKSISNSSSEIDLLNQRIKGCTLLEEWFSEQAVCYKPYFDQRKYLIKDGILHLEKLDFGWWRNTFPELNNTLLTNKNYSAPLIYRFFCILAVYKVTFPMRCAKYIKFLIRKFCICFSP